MDEQVRDALITEMSSLFSLSQKYKDCANRCSMALPLLQAAKGGVEFLYDSQTAAVCRKVNDGIHPEQELLNRLCLSRHNLDSRLDTLCAQVTAIYEDSVNKYCQYESQANNVQYQLSWV